MMNETGGTTVLTFNVDWRLMMNECTLDLTLSESGRELGNEREDGVKPDRKKPELFNVRDL
jgi:hypothetical protein